ncbi:hypothetical protein F4818DRAFT_438262 [Hypoxylon cercidicola]|nr:hypothetical protein F4818DRAFT_438262 [Hypoxylon cercidicola]
MSSGLHFTGLSPAETNKVVIALVSLTAAFVILRVVATVVRSRKLFLDDWCSIIALVSLIITATVSDVFVQEGVKPGVTMLYIIQLTITINVFLDLSVWLCKTPLLLLYIRMFGVKTWLRISCYTILLVAFLPSAAGVIANAVVCAPDGNSVSLQTFKACEHIAPLFNLIIGFVSVFVDFAILVLPIPILSRLQMARRKRVGLIIVFFTGFLALLASITALYFKWEELFTAGSAQTLTIVFTNVESCTAVIVSCVPALASLYTNILGKSLFYARLKSTISRSLGLYRNTSAESGPAYSDPAGDGHATYTVIHDHASVESNPVYLSGGEWVTMNNLKLHR